MMPINSNTEQVNSILSEQVHWEKHLITICYMTTAILPSKKHDDVIHISWMSKFPKIQNKHLCVAKSEIKLPLQRWMSKMCILVHETPATIWPRKGQVYAAFPYAERLLSCFKCMKTQVIMEQPYYCTKACPPLQR